MKTLRLVSALFFVLFLATDIAAQTCKEVIAYYPNWQWYDRSQLVKPTTIKYSSYSIINYCFFKPEASGLISNTDAWADENLLLGQPDWNNGGYLPNTSIIDLAHNAGTKVMVSIGGWTLSDNFPSIAASASKRAVFAGECNRLLKVYKFDGIDIDWEYPGYADHSGTTADKQNFTVFLKEIRDSITALGSRTGKQYKLSSCFGASAANASNIEWNNVTPLLDMINLMSYDFFGAWDAVANHNSPLYAPASGDPSFNVNSAFNMLTQTYNVPASKINLGVAFYGRSQTGATALHQATSGQVDLSTFGTDDGSPTYFNIMSKMSLFNYYWDNTAKVPYLLGKPGGSAAGTFLSYDDKKAVGIKAQYVMNKGARGVIIWELTGDYLETSPGSGVVAGTPLADTLNQVFCSLTTSVNDIQSTDVNLDVFPNPASDHVTIAVNIPAHGIYELTVYDVLGQKVQAVNYDLNTGNHLILLPVVHLTNGYYSINIRNENCSISKKIIINH